MFINVVRWILDLSIFIYLFLSIQVSLHLLHVICSIFGTRLRQSQLRHKISFSQTRFPVDSISYFRNATRTTTRAIASTLNLSINLDKELIFANMTPSGFDFVLAHTILQTTHALVGTLNFYIKFWRRCWGVVCFLKIYFLSRLILFFYQLFYFCNFTLFLFVYVFFKKKKRKKKKCLGVFEFVDLFGKFGLCQSDQAQITCASSHLRLRLMVPQLSVSAHQTNA